jgi:hypothetical protein
MTTLEHLLLTHLRKGKEVKVEIFPHTDSLTYELMDFFDKYSIELFLHPFLPSNPLCMRSRSLPIDNFTDFISYDDLSNHVKQLLSVRQSPHINIAI